MPLAAGTKLGHYEILAPIGAGGMGEVYRARDTKLDRDVAVKVLSGDLADVAARRRFQREAQMASSLNHPHILTVHDVGEWEGCQYLVTEYIGGCTLREWAKRARPAWREAVELLTCIGDALATAHEAKILHHDIKPSNILVTRSGYATLADFGLAKLEERPPRGRSDAFALESTRQISIWGRSRAGPDRNSRRFRRVARLRVLISNDAALTPPQPFPTWPR